MKKSKLLRDKYKLNIIYLILMILFWVWQVLDWHFWFNDPLWHVVFYLAFIPFVSFIFWIIFWKTNKWWMFPLYALIVTLFVFLFFANWWLKVSMNFNDLLWYGFIYIICPSFWASILGVTITRIVLLVLRLLKH